MAIYYPDSNCGGGEIPVYSCNPCPDYEYGRVRSVAYVKNTFSFTDPTSPAQWAAGILADDIIVVWQTKGLYDGGVTAELVGFGDSITINGNTTHTLTYDDPNYKENCDFYNAIKFSQEYYGVFRTSTQIHLTGAPITVTPKNPVADDINSVVTWNVTWKWTNPDSPCAFNTPAGIFDSCYVQQ